MITKMKQFGLRLVFTLATWQTGLQLEAIARAAEPAILESEFIFETVPFASCHASTIVEPTPGALVAAWFGGTAEGKPDVAIWVSRKVAGQWTDPVEVANGEQSDGTRQPCWNPVLFQPRDGMPLWLFYKVGPSPERWWGELRTSSDGGQTWSAARRLPEGILGPIKNKPLQLAQGTLICGSSSEGLSPPPVWQLHFERSTDMGRTWNKIRVPVGEESPAAIQPSILQHADGRLEAVGRTRSGRIFTTSSTDLGISWTPLTLTDLPNPNSGTDAVTLADYRHLLIYNHTARGRSPLNLAIAQDDGTWQAALVLESTPGEYSYPAIIQTADGRVHAVYTWRRQRIKHVVIDPALIEPLPFEDGRWPK